ncbi:MAG TPA: argininosuccinate lyase [Thermoplasmata archaeon]|nr:argininosuccinate lyase [Thermoplasmata archaeon]
MSNAVRPPSYVRTPHAAFLRSLEVDRPLALYDLAGSIAHVEMLGRSALLTTAEVATIRTGLVHIGREIRDGTFPWRDDLEDVHTNVEARLTEIVGPVGGKLHTARSRNDQVALDERLFLRAAVHDLGERLLRLQDALLLRAGQELDTAMPGYTHLQRAQPVTLGHYLLAHFWRFDRDLDRLLATERRANVSPLGAGALAGSTLPTDPAWVAERLGFESSFANSLDAVADRDPFAELLFDVALLAVHASGFAEEVVVFATKEFGFLERTSALGSGSSLMPQKRNPDAAELVRGQAGRAIGGLVALLTTLKGLPLAYNRDLQEDKSAVLDSLTTVRRALEALTGIVGGWSFDRARLDAAARDPELGVTDAAERLVASGVPFREAHESVAAAARTTGGEAPPFDPATALRARVTPGGPGPAAVRVQLERAHARRLERSTSLSSLGRRVDRVEELLNEAIE